MIRSFAALAGFAAVAALLVWIAAGALAAASERTVTYRYLSDALTPVAAPDGAVTWQAPTRALDRAVTPADQALTGRALSDAFQTLAVAQSTGETGTLADGFTGIALGRALASVADAKEGGGRMAVLQIAARPTFFHRDGSVLQAELTLTTARFRAEGAEDGAIVTLDHGVATLMNESSGWRVASWELRKMAPVEPTRAAVAPGDLRGLNYYPAATPWRAFWRSYDSATVAADLAWIAEMGGTAVRIFLPREAFADDTTDLANLSDLLALARRSGLRVIPTLFDLKGNYGPGTWAGDAAWLGRVLPVLRASGAVAFVDLKNEPDLDFQRQGTATVLAWLAAMAAQSRQIAPDLPLSVGWSAAEHAARMAEALDVVSYHDYAEPAGVRTRLAGVRRVAGDRPVVVSEIGHSSYELALGFPGSPEAQAAALALRLEALAPADGVLVWTLHDFPKVDAAAIGSSPWVRRLQSSFGLVGRDGLEKPAAAAVRAAFAAREAP